MQVYRIRNIWLANQALTVIKAIEKSTFVVKCQLSDRTMGCSTSQLRLNQMIGPKFPFIIKIFGVSNI